MTPTPRPSSRRANAAAFGPAASRAYLAELERFGIKLGLDNIRTLLASLGHPETACPSILVAGTNGKGSVCAMLASILGRRGFRAGLYTSPHLVRVEERIRIGGRTIAGADFRRLLRRVRDRAATLLRRQALEAPPTYFEVLTAVAFLYFRERRADIAVLEVGLGGRFDATNVVRPLVSVITSIGLDHREHLGDTIERIAFEKAGIARPGVPLVTGALPAPARRVIEAAAREAGAPVVAALDDGGALTAERTASGYAFEYAFRGETFRFSPRLRGAHQGANAAVAIAVAKTLGEVWQPLDRAAIVRGLEAAKWPGRLEAVAERPLVLLDGAHNEDGARALRAYLDDFGRRPVVLVFCAMRDKDIGALASILFPAADRIVATTFPFPRAASPAEIEARSGFSAGGIVAEPDLVKALRLARRLAGPSGTVVVTGSLYLVGEAKKIGLL